MIEKTEIEDRSTIFERRFRAKVTRDKQIVLSIMLLAVCGFFLFLLVAKTLGLPDVTTTIRSFVEQVIHNGENY
jgi:hypothetical protein